MASITDMQAYYQASARPTPKKKKPPTQKPTGSFDPSGSLGGFSPQQLASMSPDELAQVQFALGMAGPQQPDFEALQAAALRTAQASAQPQIDYINQERARQDARQKLSSDAATNFSSAFAQILQGGKTGAEGEQYALENFGGSYLGGIAARMGQQLIAQQQDYFNETDFKLASQLADVMDQIPGEADKIYQDLVSQTQDILTAPYKNQIAAIAALIKNKRDAMGGSGAPETQKIGGSLYERDPKTGKWVLAVAAPTDTASSGGSLKFFSQKGGGVLVLDSAGNVVNRIPGTGGTTSSSGGSSGGSASAGKPISFSAASTYARSMTSNTGSLWKVRKTKGGGFEAYDTGKPVAGADGAAGGTVQPRTTPEAITKIGERAVTKVLDAIWAKMPGSNAEQGTPEYAKADAAYQTWLDSGKSFGTAMAKVINAIGPSLRKVGYTRDQVREAAYRIVAAEMDPPKGYKVPKASAARVAASKLPAPQSIDFNWLATATTGKGGWADLGGPSAHYAKHDSGENWQSNNAWDISLPVGTPLYAVADGVIGPDVGVQSSRPNDGMRLTLNGQGNAFWYAHLSKIAVKPGQRVKAGQLLGYSGASQNGAAHLHIGVENLGGNYS